MGFTARQTMVCSCTVYHSAHEPLRARFARRTEISRRPSPFSSLIRMRTSESYHGNDFECVADLLIDSPSMLRQAVGASKQQGYRQRQHTGSRHQTWPVPGLLRSSPCRLDLAVLARITATPIHGWVRPQHRPRHRHVLNADHPHTTMTWSLHRNPPPKHTMTARECSISLSATLFVPAKNPNLLIYRVIYRCH